MTLPTIRNLPTPPEPVRPGPTYVDADQIDVIDHLSGIWRYRFLIAGVTLAAMVAALGVGLTRTRVYQATATLSVAQSRFGDQTSQLPPPPAASFRPLIASGSAAQAVIQELGLDKPPYQITVSTFLNDVIEIEEVRGTPLLLVSATLADPGRAAATAQRVAERGVALSHTFSAAEGERARVLIKEQLDLVTARWFEAEARYKAYREQAQIEALRKDVEATLKERGNVLDLLVRIEVEKAKLSRLEAELAKRPRIDTLKRTIDSEPALSEAARGRGELLGMRLDSENINMVFERLDNDAATTRANLAGLERQKSELVDVRHVEAAKLPQLTLLYQRESELARLEVESELAKRIFLDMSARYEVARLQVGARSAELQILDPAIVPDRPLSRNVARNSALAGVAGLSGSTLLAMLLHALQLARSRKLQNA